MPNTSKWTTAQVIFLHSLESLGLSSLITILVAAIQYLVMHGLNWPGLGTILATAFTAQMIMVYKSLRANPQTQQAVIDTVKQILGQAGLPSVVDTPAIARQIVNLLDMSRMAALLSSELRKPSSPSQYRASIPDIPTAPSLNAVRANTPPVGGSVIPAPDVAS